MRYMETLVTGADFRAKCLGWRGSDKFSEERDLGAGYAEARAQECIERQLELRAGFRQSEHGITGVAAVVADGTTGDFPLCHQGANVVFGSVGVEGNFWAVEDAQQFILVARQSSK